MGRRLDICQRLSAFWEVENISPSFEMPSRCVRDAFEMLNCGFVNIFSLFLPLSSPSPGRGWGWASPPPQGGAGVGSLFLRSSFALPSLYLRLATNEKVEAKWSYSEGIARWQQAQKNNFQYFGTSSQNGSILLIISRLIVWRTQIVRHTFVTLRHADRNIAKFMSTAL